MKNIRKLLAVASVGCFTLSATSLALANILNTNEHGVLIDDAAMLIDVSEQSAVQYIIKFKEVSSDVLSADSASSTFSVFEAERSLAQVNAEIVSHLPFIHASVAKLTPSQLKQLQTNASIEYIEVDQKRFLFDVVAPLAQSTPYGITMVQANQVSDLSAGNTKVCIIDTGYQLGHEDLQSSGVTGYSFSGHGAWSTDGHGHGTHVAGTMVALSNGVGVVGVIGSGQTDVHVVKIFNNSGSWTTASNLVTAVQSCKDAGAKVVNMSLGGASSTQTERTAFTNFYNGGMLLVAAAGNDGNTALSYPASYDAVISVAAVDSSGNLASFSQRNAQVELSGPGVSVQSTLRTGGYGGMSGTSMASPHVAGVAALVWSNHPQCTPVQIRNALNATALDRGTAGRDNSYGWGIVKAKAAHDYLTLNGCSGGSTPPVTPPTAGDTITGVSASSGQWVRYSYQIPAGVSSITFSISGGSGDADLYVRSVTAPTTSAYTCRPYLSGNNEVCTINNPQAGTWHVGIRAYSTFSGVTFSYQY